MKNAVIYVHGKGGSTDEANHYKKLFNDDYEVIGFDYKGNYRGRLKKNFKTILILSLKSIVKFY